MESNPPKTPILGAWRGVFKPNTQNIKTFILSKVLQRFKPDIAQRYRPPSSLRGSSQYTPDISKMAEAAILKIVKSPYLSNRLTDFDEIWHADADWPPTGDRSLKFSIFQKKLNGGVIFKNHTNRDITTRDWQIFAKFGMTMQNVSVKRPDR